MAVLVLTDQYRRCESVVKDL